MPEGLDRLLGDEATEELLEGGTPEGLRRLMGLAWGQPACLLDYLPASTAVVIDERRHGLAHGQQWLDHAIDHHGDMASELGLSEEERDALWPAVLHRNIEEAYALAEARHGFDMAELLEEDGHPNSFDLASRPMPAYPNQFGKLGDLIKGFQKEKTAVWLISAQPSRAVALLEEHDCIGRFVPNPADAPAIARLIEQNTPVALKSSGTAELEGLQLPAWRLARSRTASSSSATQAPAATCVVAARRPAARSTPTRCGQGLCRPSNRGIGRFKLEAGGVGDVRDYLVVQYADEFCGCCRPTGQPRPIPGHQRDPTSAQQDGRCNLDQSQGTGQEGCSQGGDGPCEALCGAAAGQRLRFPQ